MQANGAIIYSGPSVLDGSPIVAIATGLARSSRNEKTGGEVQVWIIRSDVSPVAAIETGADASICGDCRHRGSIVDGKNVGRSCYVTVWQAPRSVYESLGRGIYAPASADVFAGKTVRIGAYGDPAAVPFDVWQSFLGHAAAVTGYTHQWRSFPALKAYCMASCDNGQDYLEAKRNGWRTFRVRTASESLNLREVVCPASKEAGYKTNCAACKACGGFSAKAKVDVAIIAHGSSAKVSAFLNAA